VKKLLLLAFLLLQFSLATTSFGAINALSTPGNGSIWHWSGGTIGWQFTTSQSINVTGLGIWDYQSNGLIDSHSVGIWDMSGNLLASSVVSAGTGNALDGGFRWVNIPSYSLAAGTYVVGAYMPSTADLAVSDVTYTTASGITYNRNLYLYNAGFTRPTVEWFGHNGGNFGANFRFEPASVPEPSSLLAFTGLTICFGAGRWWQKRRSRTSLSALV
jgi:hypothetical protein